jgi:DNA-binding transcriptional MerR regulator
MTAAPRPAKPSALPDHPGRQPFPGVASGFVDVIHSAASGAPAEAGAGTLSVAGLARVTQSTPHTVRFYEREGLLPPPPRTSAGYRRYGQDAVDRLRFIEGAQRLGLRLREIRDLLKVRDEGSCPCGEAAVLLRDRITELDQQIEQLVELRGTLSAMESQIPSQNCPDPAPGVWRRPAADET